MKPSKALIQQVLSLTNKSEVIDFLRGILTPQEIEMLNQRLEIVKRLKKGEPQRQIADELGVGIATVSRGARELKKGRFENV